MVSSSQLRSAPGWRPAPRTTAGGIGCLEDHARGNLLKVAELELGCPALAFKLSSLLPLARCPIPPRFSLQSDLGALSFSGWGFRVGVCHTNHLELESSRYAATDIRSVGQGSSRASEARLLGGSMEHGTGFGSDPPFHSGNLQLSKAICELLLSPA